MISSYTPRASSFFLSSTLFLSRLLAPHNGATLDELSLAECCAHCSAVSPPSFLWLSTPFYIPRVYYSVGAGHHPSPFPGSGQRVPRGLHADGRCSWPTGGQGLCAGALKCDVTTQPMTGHACLLHAAGLRRHDGLQRCRRIVCFHGQA